jgi:hypothetical protein
MITRMNAKLALLTSALLALIAGANIGYGP